MTNIGDFVTCGVPVVPGIVMSLHKSHARSKLKIMCNIFCRNLSFRKRKIIYGIWNSKSRIWNGIEKMYMHVVKLNVEEQIK